MSVRVVAGGGVLWRGDPAAPHVAVVHRPAYDDWSLPKGKTKPGEHILVAALREVAEETGHSGRIGPALGVVRYQVRSNGRRAQKIVSYWSMRAIGGRFTPNREVDDLAWLPTSEAVRAVTSDNDRAVLDTFLRAPRDTEPLILVRHGPTAASSRKNKQGGQQLNRAGLLQARALAAVVMEVGVSDLLSADVPSCVETLQPTARATGLPVRQDSSLSREQFAGRARDVADRLRRTATDSEGLVVCGQRPVLSALLAALDCRRVAQRRRHGIDKGGWWLLHHRAGVVHAIERFPPGA